MEPMQVIAAPRRLRILTLVWDQELSAGRSPREFDVSWSAISQHLTILKTAGFVVERREGRSRLYRADPDALGLAAGRGRGALARRPGPDQGPRRGRATRAGPDRSGQ